MTNVDHERKPNLVPNLHTLNPIVFYLGDRATHLVSLTADEAVARGNNMIAFTIGQLVEAAVAIGGLKFDDTHIWIPLPCEVDQEEVKRASIFAEGRLAIDFGKREMKVNDQIVDTSNKEFGVLQTLVRNRPRLVTHAQILDSVWGYGDDYAARSNLIEHVRRVRTKLG